MWLAAARRPDPVRSSLRARPHPIFPALRLLGREMAKAHSLRHDAHALTQLAVALIDHPVGERLARMAQELFAAAKKSDSTPDDGGTDANAEDRLRSTPQCSVFPAPSAR